MRMPKDDLEVRCRKAVIAIADDVKDINYKLTHLLESWRNDYYRDWHAYETGEQ